MVIIGLRGTGRGDFAGLAKSTPNAKVYFGRFEHCRDTIRIHLQGFDSRKCSDIVRGSRRLGLFESALGRLHSALKAACAGSWIAFGKRVVIVELARRLWPHGGVKADVSGGGN